MVRMGAVFLGRMVGNCAPSRWEMLALPLQLYHGQQVRGWERVCKP